MSNTNEPSGNNNPPDDWTDLMSVMRYAKAFANRTGRDVVVFRRADSQRYGITHLIRRDIWSSSDVAYRATVHFTK